MRVSALLAVLAVCAACSAPPPPPTGLEAEVPGTRWSLERVIYDDGRVVRAQAEQVAFGPEGSISISSCNQCGGRYAVEDSLLTVEPALACTRRACLPGTIELETFLLGTSVIRRDGAYLVVEPDSVAAQVLLLPTSESL